MTDEEKGILEQTFHFNNDEERQLQERIVKRSFLRDLDIMKDIRDYLEKTGYILVSWYHPKARINQLEFMTSENQAYFEKLFEHMKTSLMSYNPKIIMVADLKRVKEIVRELELKTI